MMLRLLLLYCTVSILLSLVQGQIACNEDNGDSIRLNTSGVFSSSNGRAGRVEICQCTPSSCSWQTVSTGSLSSPFSWKNSIVACRELGFEDVQSPILQNSVIETSHADDTVAIFHLTFICDGTESTLAECGRGGDTSSQTHESDAYIFCQLGTVDRKVRLTGSTDPDEGVVEYFVSENNLSWVTICPDFWRDVEADVFCRSLGYRSGRATTYPRTMFNDDANIDKVNPIGSVTCNADQVSFTQCTPTFATDCADFDTLAGAICSPDSTTEGSARLVPVDQNSIFQRVEVFYAGRWGTVCNTAWEIESGRVACDELDNNRDLTQVPGIFTPIATSSRPIWIRGYSCDGSESRLRDCSRPNFPIGYPFTSCSHAIDAGLYCERTPDPPHSQGLSGGEIAAIVICCLLFVGTLITIIVLHDKHKKGELKKWYDPKKARFLSWYGERRTCFRQCCCCCCDKARKRRERRVQQQRQRQQEREQQEREERERREREEQEQGERDRREREQREREEQERREREQREREQWEREQQERWRQQQMPPVGGAIVPTAPPSYDETLQIQSQQQFRPPPDYNGPVDELKALPYPSNDYNAAFPPLPK